MWVSEQKRIPERIFQVN